MRARPRFWASSISCSVSLRRDMVSSSVRVNGILVAVLLVLGFLPAAAAEHQERHGGRNEYGYTELAEKVAHDQAAHGHSYHTRQYGENTQDEPAQQIRQFITDSIDQAPKALSHRGHA